MRLAHAGDRHPGPRQPRNGNRIWLVTSVVTVLVMVFVAVKLTGSGCRPARRAGGSAAAAAVGGFPPAGDRTGGAEADGAGHPASAGSMMASPMAARPGPARSIQGHAVFYDPGQAAGSCGLGPFPAGGWYASLPPRGYASGRACGSYVDVSGPAGTVRAEVVDVCTDCAAGTVDLSRAAFARIADPRTGTVAVSFQPAVDPPLPGPLVLRMTAAGRPGTLAVQVINHGNRLLSVAASGPGGRWQRLVPGADGYWTGPVDAGDAPGGTAGGTGPALGGGAGQGGSAAGPGRGGGAAARRIRVRITDIEGHEVVLTGIPARSTVVHATAWMYRAVPAATRAPGAGGTPARRASPGASAGSC